MLDISADAFSRPNRHDVIAALMAFAGDLRKVSEYLEMPPEHLRTRLERYGISEIDYHQPDRKSITAALIIAQGEESKAAKYLGISVETLNRRLEETAINPSEYTFAARFNLWLHRHADTHGVIQVN
jgi:DNA-binding NtrC family response regulator